MSLEDLMPLNEALLLEKSKFNKIVKAFMEHTSYCGSMFLPEKMNDWCSYLQCDGTTCKNDLVLGFMEKPKILSVITNNCNTNVTKDPILDFNGTCFDLFFCLPSWAEKDYHYVLGLFGMALVIFGLIFSLIYLIGFRKEFGKQDTKTLLLSCQAVCDIICILVTIIGSLSIYTYHSSMIDQLKLYSSFQIYVVAYVFPILSMFESMSIWIWILLIFDRFNFLSHGTHSKNLLTTKLCLILMALIFISLMAFSILKLFMYEMKQLPLNTYNYRLAYSNLGNKETYQNLISFWLKMPLEGLLPLTTVFIFISMVFHKLIFSISSNLKKTTSIIDFREHRLTKSILIICCFLLFAKVPKMALHIARHEIDMDLDVIAKFYLFSEIFDFLYYCIKACFLYQYMCPTFSRLLQNIMCFDQEYENQFSHFRYSNEVKKPLFDQTANDYVYQASNMDKETIV